MGDQTQFGVRKAVLDDLEILTSLIERSCRSLQTSDYTSSQIEGALGNALGLDTQLVRDETYFVAFVNSDPKIIVGCGGWSFRKTLFGSDHAAVRVNELLDPYTDAAKIRAIFIDPAWARQGIGSLLLQYCENKARDAGFLAFEMGSTLTGVPLYARKGYVKFKEIAIPLPNGEVLPIVQMVKTAH